MAVTDEAISMAAHRLPRFPGRALRLALGLAMVTAGVLYTARSQAVLALDQQPIAYLAPMDFSTYNLASGNAVAFRGDYVRATWDGDLVAHNVSSSATFSVKWRARDQLPSAANRKIFTSTASGSGVAFRWSGTSAISSAQQALLGDSTTGPQILDWLRGDSSNEISASNPTAPYRRRFSNIGAVIHSRPYYDRGTVYVGANDGMLHAFDATTGVETFAYVPSMLFTGGRLASVSTPYQTTFPYTVDGPLAIGAVGSMRLLVGGLGAGDKGLYALDVTSPAPTSETNAAAMAKWELTEASTGFANLGNVMTAPVIAKLNTGDTAVLVSSGLNNAAGVSSLFVIRASDGAKLGEISAGGKLADGTDNALGGIAAVDTDGNGTVDVVYAGDLKGTLWKFDLSGASLPASATAVYTPDSATQRPITAAPSVMRHPRGGLLVNFGTGRAYTSADLTSTATEYLYGVWDSALATATTPVVQTLTTVTLSSPAATVRTVSSNAVNYSSGAKGWRIALSGGERLLGGETLTDSGRYTVTTAVPNTGSTQGAWLMELNALTGIAPTAPFFDLNGDGVINTGDNSDRIASGSGQSARVDVPVGKFLGSGVWSQPVLAQVDGTLDVPLFNTNPNALLPAYTTTITSTPPPASESGVYGGHFDFDIYYNCGTAIPTKNCSGHTHVHEYDDLYDVVGVNMLNASLVAFNLSNAIPSTSTPTFKILVSNTLWSPAATLVVGSTISGQSWKLNLSPEGFLSDTPGGAAKTYTRATLSQFVYALPLTAFSNRDWGTGQTRSGLIPSQPSCVLGNANPTQAWMDGALTIQIVNSSATAADVQPNVPSDAGGYRLKDNNTARGKMVVQYTSFWHHPNKLCKTDAGWTATPAADNSSGSKSATPAAGSADPTGTFASGVFGGPSSTGTGTTTVTTTYLGNTVTVTQTFDVNGVRQIIKNSSGTVVSDVTAALGTPARSSLQQGTRPRLGRLGWKEIIR
jgi:type IV pilus assembly protein PilY1